MTGKHADRRILKLAIVGALPVLALTFCARAQIAVGSDGRALDANNRVGSGGLNSPGAVGGGVTQNQIIYGNVTGGKGFSGPIHERDPVAFFGPTSGGISDRFIANSSGIPTPYQPAIDLTRPQPFYGNDRNVAPPLGTVRVGYTGTYIGTTAMTDSPFMRNPLAAPFAQEKQQLGTVTILGTRTTVSGTDFGEQLFQASLNNDLLQTTFSGSPLYGIQTLQSVQTENDLGLVNPNNPNGRFQFQNAEERRMRMELQQPGAVQKDDRQRTDDQSQQQQPPANNNIQQPLESIDNSALGDRANKAAGNQAMSGSLQTGGGTQNRFTLVTPEMQSTQYSELKKRLERYQSPQQVATEQQIQSQRERKAVIEKMAGPTTRPGFSAYLPPSSTPPAGAVPPNAAPNVAPPAPNTPQPTVTPPVIAAEPIKVKSLADGITARGLHELMSSGESLMHDGKFQSAVDKYNMAERIAPNNPLVQVGLANAHLGAGAYRTASETLHSVFESAEPTLMAQYDVASWMPAGRLTMIKTQLGELAGRDVADEMPEFLLAYIAYNTGDSAAAKEHLDSARKRSGGKDKVLDRLQTDWQLSSKAPAPIEMNK